jgi:hypothetical protein
MLRRRQGGGAGLPLTIGGGEKMTDRMAPRLAGCFLGGLMLFGVAMRANADLVVNGGFETGDFTGWTTSLDPFYDGVDGSAPHDGSFAAFFGNPFGISTISQSLATSAGTVYHIDFWLQTEADSNQVSTPNHFQFNWGGVSPLTIDDAPAQAYTHYSFFLPASSSTTTLAFSFSDAPAFLDFDTVSVTAVPEPGSLALVSLACALIGFARRGRS